MIDREKLRYWFRREGGYGDFAAALGDFLERESGGASPELAAAGILLGRAIEAGAVRLQLAELGGTDFPAAGTENTVRLPETEVWLAALRTALTGPAGELLRLTESGCLYLRRHYDYEMKIKDLLIGMARESRAAAEIIPEVTAADQPESRLALLAGLNSRLLVLSGGPGTGKTTTAGRILSAWLRRHPEQRVVLAAPTGKAQQRLSQEIVTLAEREGDDRTAAALRGHTAGTVHSLLMRGELRRELETCQVLVADECSMLRLELFYRLLSAVPADCKILLLGDQRQLAPIGCGFFLEELFRMGTPNQLPGSWRTAAAGCGLSGLPEADDKPLSGVLVELKYNYRSESAPHICGIAADLRAGTVRSAEQWYGIKAADFHCRRVPEEAYAQEVTAFLTGKSGETPMPENLPQLCEEGRAGEALALLESFKIICAVNEGPAGTENLNQLVLGALGLSAPPGEYRCGTAILITRNTPQLQLFNGDIGVVCRNDQGEKEVCFAAPDRRIPVALLPEHTYGFALTVHKAQGSGYKRVLLVLPGFDLPLLNLSLLYTGITRASAELEIWAEPDLLDRALSR